jgi:uncharacterized protein (DUF934 family)
MTAKLIKDGQLVNNSWELLPADANADQLLALNGSDVIVPLALWLSAADSIKQRQGKTGVWLNSHEVPAALGQDVNQIPLIALNFPEFKDGRPFSSARELRQRLGYTGEIRAIGDVLRDQLFFMRRCGFDAYVLREDQDVDSALKAFADFHEAYQAAVDQPVPLFRRRS